MDNVDTNSQVRDYFFKYKVEEVPITLYLTKENLLDSYTHPRDFGVAYSNLGETPSQTITGVNIPAKKLSYTTVGTVDDYFKQHMLAEYIGEGEDDMAVNKARTSYYKVKNIIFKRNIMPVMLQKISRYWDKTLIMLKGDDRLPPSHDLLCWKHKGGGNVKLFTSQLLDNGEVYMIENPELNCGLFVVNEPEYIEEENSPRTLKITETIGIYILPEHIIRINVGIKAIVKYYFGLLKEAIATWWKRNDRE